MVYGSSGEVNATTLQIGGTSITSSAAELNILDGVTSTAAELNILDGVTATAAELNILDGVTSTAAELNILDGVTATTAELNLLDGDTNASSTTTLVDADRIIVNDAGIMKQVALSDLKTYVGVSATSLNGLSDVLIESNSLYIGHDPNSNTSSAERNIAVGVTALDTITEGDDNVCVGYDAGTDITTGTKNTIVGSYAGDVLVSGGNNTIIGYNAAASGNNVSNEITLGDSHVTTLRCGATTIASLSDRRDKTDIKDSPYGLNLINRVRPVEFTWKTREGSSKDGATNIGFIAQELQDAMEEGENDKLRLVYESNPDRLEAMYGNLVPVMAKAIQELSQQVEELKARLDKQN